MEIEKQRGISVATSVLCLSYKDQKIENILEYTGHKEFRRRLTSGPFTA